MRCSAAGQHGVTLCSPCRTLCATAATLPALTQHLKLHLRQSGLVALPSCHHLLLAVLQEPTPMSGAHASPNVYMSLDPSQLSVVIPTIRSLGFL